VIGQGSYGKVLLVTKKGTNKQYALKILKKDEIIKRNQFEHTMAERRILVS
jgi:serine/threonine protein kinase